MGLSEDTSRGRLDLRPIMGTSKGVPAPFSPIFVEILVAVEQQHQTPEKASHLTEHLTVLGPLSDLCRVLESGAYRQFGGLGIKAKITAWRGFPRPLLRSVAFNGGDIETERRGQTTGRLLPARSQG